MRIRIAVLKKDLIDIMLSLKDDDIKKAIKKLQHFTEISDAELKDLYWKKQYCGE